MKEDWLFIIISDWNFWRSLLENIFQRGWAGHVWRYITGMRVENHLTIRQKEARNLRGGKVGGRHGKGWKKKNWREMMELLFYFNIGKKKNKPNWRVGTQQKRQHICWELGWYLWHATTRAMQMSPVCAEAWSHIHVRRPSCCWGPYWYPRPVLMSLACAAAEGHIDVCGLYCHRRPCWGPWFMLLPETLSESMVHAPAGCTGQGSSYCSCRDGYRLTVEKERHRRLCDNLPLQIYTQPRQEGIKEND